MIVGTVDIECPACREEVPVTVTVELHEDNEGRQSLVCDSDMADLWAHAWTHGEVN